MYICGEIMLSRIFLPQIIQITTFFIFLIKIMNKFNSIIALVLVVALAFVSCGGDKEAEAKRIADSTAAADAQKRVDDSIANVNAAANAEAEAKAKKIADSTRVADSIAALKGSKGKVVAPVKPTKTPVKTPAKPTTPVKPSPAPTPAPTNVTPKPTPAPTPAPAPTGAVKGGGTTNTAPAVKGGSTTPAKDAPKAVKGGKVEPVAPKQ